MIIDVHAHYFPDEYHALVEHPRFPGIGGPDHMGERIRLMDEAGVSRQVLSITVPPYLVEEAKAVQAARLINDIYADLVKGAPDRFSYWASLPLPHADAAIEEIERTLGAGDAVGVTIQCFCRNESIAQEAFEPVWAELNRRRAVVFLHPGQNAVASPLIRQFGLTTCTGASVEDAIAAMHLIGARIPERYPNIRFIVPHFGGIMPMLLQRLDGQMPQPDFAERPSVTARRFFYDTVGWGSKAALLCAYTAFGASQLVPGSDFPVLIPWESYTQTFRHIAEGGLPDEEVQQILHHNVQQLLGLD